MSKIIVNLEENLINSLRNPTYLPFTTWTEHIPFAYFLVSYLNPKVFVELGVFKGGSFLNFCQAIKMQGLTCDAYGVDSWLGDSHAGPVTEDFFIDVKRQVDSQYSAFAKLLRMAFDEAVHEFADKTIDLLHIDGYHSYEIVKHDYETWLPKIAKNGIILFHDITVKENNFGVWKLWDELKVKFPHISFEHGYGLGVLFTGELSEKDHQFISLFKAQPFYIHFFEQIGFYLQKNYDAKEAFVREEARNNALTNQLQTEQGKVKDLEGQLQGEQTKSQGLTTQLQTEQGKAKDLEGQLQGEQTKSKGLAAQLQAEQGKVKDLEGQLQGEQAKSKGLATQLQAEQGKVKNLEERLYVEQAKFNNFVTENDTKNKQLVMKNQELEQTKNELVSIYVSKSWRWTRPLRKIKNVWRMVKRKNNV